MSDYKNAYICYTNSCRLMKIFQCDQINDIDAYTINNEPISSIDLMERAAISIFNWFVSKFSSIHPVFIFVGPGNNGGDGLALARLLIDVGYNVNTIVLSSSSYSNDNRINFKRLEQQGLSKITEYNSEIDFPLISDESIIVDCLFGSGLTRPLQGMASSIVNQINSTKVTKVSVDIPSGLFGEHNPHPNSNSVINANFTLSLQFPKLSFFFPENYGCVGNWELIDIGLHPDIIESTSTPFYYVDSKIVSSIIKPRTKFSHKGNYGHCLIVAGSYGMLGASVLCSQACIRAGAGLVTSHIPRLGYSVLQHTIPEAIVEVDDNDWYFSGVKDLTRYSAIAVGPGIGQETRSIHALRTLLSQSVCPIVIDADGLNIISKIPELFELIPENTIITPHIGEFNRLFGTNSNSYERLNKAIEVASKRKILIVIKGAHSHIICPDGRVFFNSTGNPGMATAGSGDVLSGIITSFLGQGYSPENAAILGVFLHGKSGDIAFKCKGGAINATDIVNYFGSALSEAEIIN